MALGKSALSVALIAAFSGFIQHTQAAKTPISQDLYNAFVRYTRFSAAAYASSCPDPPGSAVVAKFFNEASTDTQAFLLRDAGAKELILTFRGTSSIQDFATDFDQKLVPFTTPGVTCSGCQVHEGYLKQWNSVEGQVTQTIRDMLTNGYKLTVTGHSMGASLAVLASASLKGQGLSPTVYTFGQPRTGNPAFASYIDTNLPENVLFRVTHSNDGVPQTITRKDGYQHHKTEYWGNDPPSVATTVKCEGDEPADCNNSVPGIGLGANGTGINAAHLLYFGISIGNPLDPGVTECV